MFGSPKSEDPGHERNEPSELIGQEGALPASTQREISTREKIIARGFRGRCDHDVCPGASDTDSFRENGSWVRVQMEHIAQEDRGRDTAVDSRVVGSREHGRGDSAPAQGTSQHPRRGIDSDDDKAIPKKLDGHETGAATQVHN